MKEDDTLPLFDDDVVPDIVGMVHAGDPPTSLAAATVIAAHKTELHAKVLAAFAAHGPMTDEDLENLPEFHAYGPSTIRKRRSELYQQHALVALGEAVNSRGRTMLVWTITDPDPKEGT